MVSGPRELPSSWTAGLNLKADTGLQQQLNLLLTSGLVLDGESYSQSFRTSLPFPTCFPAWAKPPTTSTFGIVSICLAWSRQLSLVGVSIWDSGWLKSDCDIHMAITEFLKLFSASVSFPLCAGTTWGLESRSSWGCRRGPEGSPFVTASEHQGLIKGCKGTKLA